MKLFCNNRHHWSDVNRSVYRAERELVAAVMLELDSLSPSSVKLANRVTEVRERAWVAEARNYSIRAFLRHPVRSVRVWLETRSELRQMKAGMSQRLEFPGSLLGPGDEQKYESAFTKRQRAAWSMAEGAK